MGLGLELGQALETGLGLRIGSGFTLGARARVRVRVGSLPGVFLRVQCGTATPSIIHRPWPNLNPNPNPDLGKDAAVRVWDLVTYEKVPRADTEADTEPQVQVQAQVQAQAQAREGLGLELGLSLSLRLGPGPGLSLSLSLSLSNSLSLRVKRGGYFLRLHAPCPTRRLMQRVLHHGCCQGIPAATEWDPTAMMLGHWRLNPIPNIRQ